MRILLLSYCFPPVPLIEAQVTAKVSAHLGAEVDVVCADASLWRLPADHSLDTYVSEHFASVSRVHRPGTGLVISAWGHFRPVANRPDALRMLNRRVLAHLDTLDLQSYDLLVTRSEFHSVHLVPLALARRPPWVAHLSDPWVGDPARSQGPLAGSVNRRLEARVMHAADRTVFTSEKAAEFTLLRYDESVRRRAAWVPHSFEPSLFGVGDDTLTAPPRDGGAPILARHVGHLRQNRHPEPLFRALRQLEQQLPGSLSQVRIELVGLISAEMLASPAARSLPAGLVNVRAPVDYRASLEAMAGAELLLVTEVANTAGIDLHAKIVDYAGAAVPIVGFVPDGPTAELIRELGGWTATPDDTTGGAEALARGLACARRRRSGGHPWGDPAVRERIAAPTVGRRLAEIYATVARAS